VSRSSWRLLGGLGLFAAAVWNGIFDFLISRGEREYFWAQARAESGAGPPVVLHDMMQETIAYAATVAHWWAGVTVVAGLLLIRFARRQASGPRQ
jgi:hypothetical protein